jgi:threonine/homoserine/homoserine lactone efflux protein
MTLPIEMHLLAAFIAASLVLLVVPGPTVIMVVSQALAHGRRTALACVAGVGLADLVALSLSILGVGTILAASAAAFEAVKWVGAAYLVWIGIKMWRVPVTPHLLDLKAADVAGRTWPVFRDSFLVTVFNPKGIVFYITFMPQFISPAHAFAPQAALLAVIFIILSMTNAGAYALLASTARQWIRRPRVLMGATRTGAAFLMSAGIASLFVKRAA